jgi:hypothetical protein
MGKKESNMPRSPVVTGCDRTRFSSRFIGQNRPQDKKIKVAGMVGEIDSLSSFSRASEPPRLRAGENADADREEFRDHVASNS